MAVLKRSPVAAALLVAGFLALPPETGARDTAAEYDVKAAFLYSFTKFIEWPESAFHDDRSSLRLCVLGDDPFGGSLQEIMNGEVAGRHLTVLRVSSLKEPAGCQVLFVSRSEREKLPQILNAVREAPVLTVGDTSGFLEEGGIVNFVLQGSKVRFEINQASAERAGIRISSKLLRLATRVLFSSPRQGP
jgi:hypothetical protein